MIDTHLRRALARSMALSRAPGLHRESIVTPFSSISCSDEGHTEMIQVIQSLHLSCSQREATVTGSTSQPHTASYCTGWGQKGFHKGTGEQHDAEDPSFIDYQGKPDILRRRVVPMTLDAELSRSHYSIYLDPTNAN